MKKIFSILFLLFTLIICLKNVQASSNENTTVVSQKIINFGIFDRDFTSSINKFKKTLPFVNVAIKNMTYDTDILSSGISLGNESIKAEKNLKGIQLLMATDTVTIEGNCEYGIILATNVVIKGRVEKDLLIVAQSVFITETAEIGNDVTIVSSKVEVRGTISGNLLGMAQELFLSGTVEKDLRIRTKDIKLENENIKGDVYLSTDTDMSDIIKKYPNAVIEKYTTETTKKERSIDIYTILTKGAVVVFTYTFVAYLLNKKENKVIQLTTDKFKKHMPFAFFIGVLLLILLPVIVIGLLFLAIAGLGVIAWPILIVYIAFIILTYLLDVLIVGLVVINMVINLINKEKLNTTKKIFIYLGIFTAIYALNYLLFYITVLCAILSIGIVLTSFTKKPKDKEKTEEKVENVKEEK